MELLLLLLLTPSVIPAQRYRSSSSTSSLSSNPNDEPFLPIYPIYPYSPKLIKRGTERDLVGQLTPELYAPKLDARDTYTSSFGGNYQRDPYYPSYNPYPKTSSSYPASSPVSNPGYTSTGSYPTTASFASPSAYTTSNSAYSTQNVAAGAAAGGAYTTPNTYSPYGAGYTSPYPYSAAPYGIYNSYSTPYTTGPTPYPTSPYAAGAYPNYNYQAPYYYPNYYNQPYPAHPPPPPLHSDYSGSSSSEDSSEETETNGKTSSSSKKSENKKNRYKDNDSETSSESKDGQFVDGGNFLSSGAKDLDGQSTTYKAPNAYNQLEQGSDVHLRSVTIPGLPRTTYRVISVGGQPVGPDYPLPQSYAKVQQLEQIMSQTLAKLLAQQNTANQAAQTQYQYPNNEQPDNSGGFGISGLINKSPQSVIAKTGLAYRVGPNNLPKTVNNNVGGQFVSNYGTGQNPLVIKVQDPGQSLQQSSTILSKAAGKYADEHYSQKPVTTVSLQQSSGVYIPPEAKNLKDENSSDPSEQYNDYDTNAGQNYENSNPSYKKNEQNYGIDQSQGVPYHSSNLVTVQTPQAQSYQYSSYLPTQSTQQQQQLRDYKTSLDDVNFGTKRNSKV